MMKNLYKYLILAAAAVLALAACADHRSDYMEEFQTMVYFRNGGEQNITLFRTGENGFYKIPVCKSGRNLKGTTSATVMPFDEAQMIIYNTQTGSNFSLIPSNLYTFTDEKGKALSPQDRVELTFEEDDAYKVVCLSLKTVNISALKEANPDADYVIALQVFSEGKVSDDINLIILHPDIEVPQVSFLNTGIDTHNYTSASPVKETYRNTVSLNMDYNDWEFECTLAVADETWLAEFNTANGKNYTLMPAGSYSFVGDKGNIVKFAKNQLEVSFEIEIDRSAMDMLKEYAVPVIIQSCSKTEFSINPKASAFVLNVRLDPDQITLTEDMLSVSSSHPGDGDGVPALIDDNLATYWHSVWSSHTGDAIYGEYVDIALKSPLKAIVLRYCTRNGNTNGIPNDIIVWTKANDTADWVQIGEEATEEMASAVSAQWISLSAMKSDTSFQYIRMSIVKSKSGDLRGANASFTALSELQLYGTN